MAGPISRKKMIDWFLASWRPASNITCIFRTRTRSTISKNNTAIMEESTTSRHWKRLDIWEVTK